MDITLSSATLKGSVQIISSKSDAHRALICSALAEKETTLQIPMPADDVLVTAECLGNIGVAISRQNDAFMVRPWKKPASFPHLNCKESGSTLRFLLPVAAALGCGADFAGEGRLPERPLTHLLSRLSGCTLSAEKLPFTITGKLKAGTFRLPGDVSSQYISGLLMALPYLEADSQITLSSPLESSGYTDMTVNTLSRFGVRIVSTKSAWIIKGKQKYISPQSYRVEGDWSAAAFWLAAGALGADIAVCGLNINSLQPDKTVSEILKAFGASVSVLESVSKAGRKNLQAADIDISETPDLLPILALVASLAEGTSRIYNAARLRLKESDRLHTTAELLNALGGKVTEEADALRITGVPYLKGGVTVSGANDHRIVMTAAIASLFTKEPVTITGAEAVRKSYPHFFQDFALLGGKI